MPAIEVGRLCVKTRGREAGRKCVIVEIIDDNFVVITGPRDVSGVKRRRANINHIEVLPEKIDIEPGASDIAGLQHLGQGVFVDDLAARGVDDDGMGLQQLQTPSRQKVVGRRRMRTIDRNEVHMG